MASQTIHYTPPVKDLEHGMVAYGLANLTRQEGPCVMGAGADWVVIDTRSTEYQTRGTVNPMGSCPFLATIKRSKKGYNIEIHEPLPEDIEVTQQSLDQAIIEMMNPESADEMRAAIAAKE